jgi:hypothetical protein
MKILANNPMLLVTILRTRRLRFQLQQRANEKI